MTHEEYAAARLAALERLADAVTDAVADDECSLCFCVDDLREILRALDALGPAPAPSAYGEFLRKIAALPTDRPGAWGGDR